MTLQGWGNNLSTFEKHLKNTNRNIVKTGFCVNLYSLYLTLRNAYIYHSTDILKMCEY